MASSNGEEAAAGNINPLLLASARVGSWEALELLFEQRGAQDPRMMIPTVEYLTFLTRAQRRVPAPDADDVEQGVYCQPVSLAARELLQGVTPGGDTVLHAVASNGDGQDFLKYASMICGRDSGLLFAKNHRGDTPLHCAARAGHSEMVSRLIFLAGREGDHQKLKLLRIESNLNETALHEAVRFEDGRVLGPKDREALFDADGAPVERKIGVFVQQQGMTIVKKLMVADPRLADYPIDGVSPLCLAISLEKNTIALTLYHASGGNLSYSGADGQNALHVALLRDRDTVIIEFLLHCNKNLTTQVDKDGSTPLHFVQFSSWSTRTIEKVFKVNPAALYQADKNGFFPIHVAASAGAKDAIRFFLRERPDSAGLSDARGKTLLHVAIEKRRVAIVSYACRDPSLAWILNMQDNDGNTALHLAIHAGSFWVFCALFGNRGVNLNLTNNQGKTPRDLSISKPASGMGNVGTSELQICYALWTVGASKGAHRLDKNEGKYGRRLKVEDEDKESEMLKDTTQKLIIASVLIANMAFSATFAIPGGYRSDDHANAGAPMLAGGYIFDAFIMATALAFMSSLLATTGSMFAGIPMINLATRRMYLFSSELFFSSSVTCMLIAFALGVYMVLAPVAHHTAIAICFIAAAVLVSGHQEFLLIMLLIQRPLLTRKGLLKGTVHLLRWYIPVMVTVLRPFVVTFGWASFWRRHV